MSAILTLHNPARARAYYEAGWWRGDTLYPLLERNAHTRPDRYALRDSARRLTWRDLQDWVEAIAADLHASGLQPGDRVSVGLPNRIETIAVTLACSRNGYVCNPSLHQSYTAADVADLLARVRSAALIAQPGFGADADRADIFARASELPAIKRAIRVPRVADAGREPAHGLALKLRNSSEPIPSRCLRRTTS